MIETGDDFDRWIAERNEVLRSGDMAKLRAHMTKWGLHVPTDDAVLEVTLHKARSAYLALTAEERAASVAWLKERNYWHWGDEA